MPRPRQRELIEVEDSQLILVDVQQHFLDKLTEAIRLQLLQRIIWLVEIAKVLKVPILTTAEDVDTLGGSVAAVAQHLPPETPVLDKRVFGLADDESVLSAVTAQGRNTTVLVGLETDVCITHSALGLSERGFRAVVVSDAVGSPQEGHAQGLERLRSSDVTLTSVKGLFYEWTRTPRRSEAVRSAVTALGVKLTGVCL